jgi:hypothetical protein
VLTQAGFIAIVKEVRVPEEHGPTELILDLGGLEIRAVASAIVQRLNPSPVGNDVSPLPRTGEGPGVRLPHA